MWNPEGKLKKLAIVAGLTTMTLAIHHGWVFEPLFGHYHWFHAMHGRFCYVPIVVAASWFGIRGGLITATLITLFVIPYIINAQLEIHEFVGEIVEITFYFFIAALTGALVERELLARRQKQQAEINVERSQKLSLVGQMAAGVAHEIKNPLASIKGAADIIADNSTSAEEREEFKNILHNEIRRIDATVSEFLSFAKPRETKLERINLSEIILASIKQISIQAEKERIKLESDIKDQIIINGDTEKLHQMILNLILNAIQASQQGDTITINLSREKQAIAKLEISDSGVGMSKDEIKKAIEPFYTTKSSGTGLGLAIVKSIIDNHNGKLLLTSEANNGTTVIIKLPLLVEVK